MITLCRTEEIGEGTSKGFEVNGTFLFAVKKDEQLHLYYNRCPHLGTPLEWEEDRFLDDDGAPSSAVLPTAHCLRSAMGNVWSAPAKARPCMPLNSKSGKAL